MFAAGNDGEQYDDCNAAGHVNSIYTIAINAMKINGSLADYSEECTCIMAAVYGGEGEYLIVSSLHFFKKYIVFYLRTSHIIIYMILISVI